MKLDEYCDDLLVEELINETINYLEKSEEFLTEGFFSKIKDFIMVLKDLPKLLQIGGVLDKEYEKLTDEQKSEIADFVTTNKLIQTNAPLQEGLMDIITAYYKDEPKRIRRKETLKKPWLKQITDNTKKTLNLGVSAVFLSPIILMWLGWKIIRKAAPKVKTFVTWIRDKVRDWYIKKHIKPEVKDKPTLRPTTRQKKIEIPKVDTEKEVTKPELSTEPVGEIAKREVPKKEEKPELKVGEPEETETEPKETKSKKLVDIEFEEPSTEEEKEEYWKQFVDMGVMDYLDKGKTISQFQNDMDKKRKSAEDQYIYVDRFKIPERVKKQYHGDLFERVVEFSNP